MGRFQDYVIFLFHNCPVAGNCRIHRQFIDECVVKACPCKVTFNLHRVNFTLFDVLVITGSNSGFYHTSHVFRIESINIASYHISIYYKHAHRWPCAMQTRIANLWSYQYVFVIAIDNFKSMLLRSDPGHPSLDVTGNCYWHDADNAI